MTRSQLVRELAAIILGRAGPHPLRVAFDGVDAAGKTTLADEMAVEMRACGRQIIRSSVDGFHNPREIRWQDPSPAGYFHRSFDYRSLAACLLEPLGPGGSRAFRRAAFNCRTNSPVTSPDEVADETSILLFDGVFLLRRELRAYWDLAIFVEASFETTVARAEIRDRELFVDEKAVRQRYESRYVPGQRLYLEEERPHEYAHIIVDNNDLLNPSLRRVVGSGTN